METAYGILGHGNAKPPKKHQHPKRAKHGVRKTTVHHNDDGSHHIEHEMDNGETQTAAAPDVQGLNQNMSSMLEPQEGAAPAPPAPGAPAA